MAYINWIRNRAGVISHALASPQRPRHKPRYREANLPRWGYPQTSLGWGAAPPRAPPPRFMADVREALMRIGTEDPWALKELGGGGLGGTPI